MFYILVDAFLRHRHPRYTRYTVTTVLSGQKGLATQAIPASSPLALPFADDFDHYVNDTLPHYFSDQVGIHPQHSFCCCLYVFICPARCRVRLCYKCSFPDGTCKNMMSVANRIRQRLVGVSILFCSQCDFALWCPGWILFGGSFWGRRGACAVGASATREQQLGGWV